jgi:hypothetical protein
MQSLFSAAGVAAILLLGAAEPACATTTRAWVSGHGVDQAGCGAPTSPCRSLQYAHDNIVAAGGEIDILDPAGYGAVTINKSISIVNDGVGTAGVQASSGNAITINAGPNDIVVLRGLNVDGVQHAGIDGVRFNSGASLSIQNCVVQHFNGNGVEIQVQTGATSVSITDTIVSGSTAFGIIANPVGSATLSLVFDRVTAQANLTGLAIAAQGTTSASVTLTNSLFTGNQAIGVALDAPTGTLLATVDQITSSQNGDDGLKSTSGVVNLSRSVLSQNATYGIETSNTPSPTSGVFSARNNLVVGNGSNVSGTLGTAPLM